MKAPYPVVDEFLGEFGFLGVTDIYSALKKKDLESAKAIYLKHKSWYHPLVAATIQ